MGHRSSRFLLDDILLQLDLTLTSELIYLGDIGWTRAELGYTKIYLLHLSHEFVHFE